jgi:hypothetical protein
MANASKRWLAAAGLLAAGAALGVGATLLLHHPDRSDEIQDISWALVGAGTDGRSLVVRPVDGFDACYEPPTATAVANDESISVRMEIRRHCEGDAMPAMLQLFGPVRVSLGVALHGQRISGLNGTGAAKGIGTQGDGMVVYPSLVGLNVRTASEILKANGASIRRIRLPGGHEADGASIADDGYRVVTGQEPAAGAKVRAVPAATLTAR